jgi:hypothetical protein
MSLKHKITGLISLIILVFIIGLITGHTRRLIILAGDFIEEHFYCSDIQFNSKEWRENSSTSNRCPIRSRMANELISSNRLINLDYDQVVALLGKPDNKYEEFMIYGLGPSANSTSTGVQRLQIKLDPLGKVIKVAKQTG